MWERQVRTLEDAGWPVVAPSLPGFGDTDGVGPTMTMGAAADRCLQAADAAGIERFVACGLSMGGYVAFELWRMARQRIAGLVLANTRSGADAPEAAQGRRALADRLDAEGNGFLVEQPPPLLSDQAPDELWEQVRGSIGAQPAASIGAAARGMAERTDSTPDLGAIDVPMLIVTSSLDTLDPGRGLGRDARPSPRCRPGGDPRRRAPVQPGGTGGLRPGAAGVPRHLRSRLRISRAAPGREPVARRLTG